MRKEILVFSLCIAYACSLSFVSNALGSNMVLQRAPQRANLWGWSASGTSAKVTVNFANKDYETMTGTNGKWNVFLDPTPAGGPYDISISSSTGEKAVLQNVLFGDVFVCGGQSNMQMTVASVFNASEEIKDADNYPNVRIFTTGDSNFSATPFEEFAKIEQMWSVASAKTVGLGNWSAFSAVCWFFGKNLYNFQKVPIGLVSDNWGGTVVQAWSSPDALSECKQPSSGPNDNSQLWNAMIVPILPMTITGVTWYQAEQNSGQANFYACAFPAMITDWRNKWGGETDKYFPFFFVQLAPWLQGSNTNEGLTRLAQLYGASLPNVGFATAADLGDPTSPYGSVHPRAKQEVGYRLALDCLRRYYGKLVQSTGPMAESWSVDANGVVNVYFQLKSLGSGLTVTPFSCPADVPAAQCAEYELETSTGWVPAKATIAPAGTSVVLSLPDKNAKITGVRYGFANYPLMSLHNKEGFPAIPFYFPNPIIPEKKM